MVIILSHLAEVLEEAHPMSSLSNFFWWTEIEIESEIES